MNPRTFEFDDYPRDHERLIPMLDRIKQLCPRFVATIFAVPSLMRQHHWEALIARQDWIDVGPHGFNHVRRECRTPEIYRNADPSLEQICSDTRYARVYKSPWQGYDMEFLTRLHRIGMVPCCSCLPNDTPYPAPPIAIWNHNDWMVRNPEKWWHYVFHPITDDPSEFKMAATSLTDEAFHSYLASCAPDHEWEFVRKLAEPMSIRLNIGCGEQIWPDWVCLDHRDLPGARRWQWPTRLPYNPVRADVAFSSHLFEYLDEHEYADFALDVWRVLRPCAVWRIADVETSRGYSWRPIGSTRTKGTGQIKSHPMQDKIANALWNVGFHVYPARPGETLSPCRDVLLGDNRARLWRQGHKFYLEAIKAISLRDMKRHRWQDPHATRMGHYYHVYPPHVPSTFFRHSHIVGNRRVPT